MTYFKALCYFIGVVQLVLGALYLFAPQFFVAWQGLSQIGQDINYPLAMLAGRFLVYGVGMFVIASDPVRYRIWADGMIAIQVIDLAAGLFYTGTGVVSLEQSGFPMFNATLFIIGLSLLRRNVSHPAIAA
ncbi:hypothetical protein [Profundibacter sp.]|uniref:hypothetical protein n=1 Tax=Profundibacter sp. TaxID=3101071 RepID=UPI003D105A2C